MLQKHLQFSLVYVFISMFQLFLEIDPKTAKLILADFYYIVKPAITISLIVYLTYHTQLKGRFAKRIFIGLLFGLLGDSLLMFTHIHDYFFLSGLAAFLLGHLAYLSAFFIDYSWAKGIEKRALVLAVFFFAAFCIAFYLFLKPYLGNMDLPVLGYAITISLMAIMAVSRKGRVNSLSYNLIFWGAILFMLSDSLLAYNKFIAPSKFLGVGIMITYMIAQYNLTIGAIERKMRKKSMITKGGA